MVLIDKYVVMPRATRAGAIDNFIQKEAHDRNTHIIDGRNAVKCSLKCIINYDSYLMTRTGPKFLAVKLACENGS